MKREIKPSFSKDFANKVDKETFIEHFKEAYPEITKTQLGGYWQDLQEQKKEVVKEEKLKGK